MFGILVKQFTNCRLGMMSWGLTLMIAAAQRSGLSNAMFVCVTLQLLYIAKFFCWERGYLQTMDMAHDRAGFYICWGCLVWPPAVYSSPALYLVHHPHSLPAWAYTEATYESADGIQRVNLLLASGFGGGWRGTSVLFRNCWQLSRGPFLLYSTISYPISTRVRHDPSLAQIVPRRRKMPSKIWKRLGSTLPESALQSRMFIE